MGSVMTANETETTFIVILKGHRGDTEWKPGFDCPSEPV